MHIFDHFELSQLRKIVRNYNLHVKIAKYSKLSKPELVKHLSDYLVIDSTGKIMIKDEVLNKVDDELNKIKAEMKAKKEPKAKAKPKAKPKAEPKKEEPKMEDYSHLEPEHAKHAKEYHPLYKKVNAKLDELMPFLKTEKLITSRRGQPKTEAEKLSHYFNRETSDSSKNGIEASVRALKYLDKKLNEFRIQKAFHDIKPKEEPKKEKEMPKEEKPKEENINKIKKEINKLEKLIKIDQPAPPEIKKEIKKEEKRIFKDLNEYKEYVKQTYKKKALEYHPDKNVGNEEQAKKRFQRLGNAYEKN